MFTRFVCIFVWTMAFVYGGIFLVGLVSGIILAESIDASGHPSEQTLMWSSTGGYYGALVFGLLGLILGVLGLLPGTRRQSGDATGNAKDAQRA